MPNLSRAYQWAINTCNQPKVGYSQTYRNRVTKNGITYYDCSSFIWYSLLDGGFDVTNAYRIATGVDYSGNAITTSAEEAFLIALGFTSLPVNSEWKSGDILLRSGHTEMVYTGGNASGVTMGAHNASVVLDKQVSINTSTSYASSWTKLFRYGGGGAKSTVSISVVSAICGNFIQESTINPGIWQGLNIGTWTDLLKGYGLGQWTNTGGDTHGRLYLLHDYLTKNGYSVEDGNGQIAYLIAENYWLKQAEAISYNSLSDFLSSESTDLTHLTHAFNIGWEGIHDSSWDLRVSYAEQCFAYISSHQSEDVEWISGNRYLSSAEYLNNALCVYKALSSVTPPTPPHPVKTKHTMPLYMMMRRW